MMRSVIARAATVFVIVATTATASAAGSLNAATGERHMSPIAIKALLLAKPAAKSAPGFFHAAAPVYGERCVTEIGFCEILPQPVGSPCMCGDVTGITLQ